MLQFFPSDHPPAISSHAPTPYPISYLAPTGSSLAFLALLHRLSLDDQRLRHGFHGAQSGSGRNRYHLDDQLHVSGNGSMADLTENQVPTLFDPGAGLQELRQEQKRPNFSG